MGALGFNYHRRLIVWTRLVGLAKGILYPNLYSYAQDGAQDDTRLGYAGDREDTCVVGLRFPAV